MHSLQECVRLHTQLEQEVAGMPEAEDLLQTITMFKTFAMRHLTVIEKWGRFPHRNAVLGRENTPEEEEGMASGVIEQFG